MTIHGVGHNPMLYRPLTPAKPSAGNEQAVATSITEQPLAQPSSIEQQPVEQQTTAGEKPNHLESFTYGALGMDHPEDVKKNKDDYYTAGQFLSAAATVGGILLMVV